MAMVSPWEAGGVREQIVITRFTIPSGNVGSQIFVNPCIYNDVPSYYYGNSALGGTATPACSAGLVAATNMTFGYIPTPWAYYDTASIHWAPKIMMSIPYCKVTLEMTEQWDAAVTAKAIVSSRRQGYYDDDWELPGYGGVFNSGQATVTQDATLTKFTWVFTPECGLQEQLSRLREYETDTDGRAIWPLMGLTSEDRINPTVMTFFPPLGYFAFARSNTSISNRNDVDTLVTIETCYHMSNRGGGVQQGVTIANYPPIGRERFLMHSESGISFIRSNPFSLIPTTNLKELQLRFHHWLLGLAMKSYRDPIVRLIVDSVFEDRENLLRWVFVARNGYKTTLMARESEWLDTESHPYSTWV